MPLFFLPTETKSKVMTSLKYYWEMSGAEIPVFLSGTLPHVPICSTETGTFPPAKSFMGIVVCLHNYSHNRIRVEQRRFSSLRSLAGYLIDFPYVPASMWKSMDSFSSPDAFFVPCWYFFLPCIFASFFTTFSIFYIIEHFLSRAFSFSASTKKK